MHSYAVLMSSNKSETISIIFVGKQDSSHSLGYTNLKKRKKSYVNGTKDSICDLALNYSLFRGGQSILSFRLSTAINGEREHNGTSVLPY